MSEAITASTSAMEQFQQRVLDQIKENIAGLLPDEALAKLVERAVQETFFQTRKVRRAGQSSWGTEMEDAPSWFSEEVFKQVTPLIQEHVRKYLEDNPQIIKDVIDAALDRDKVAVTMSWIVGSQLQVQMGQTIGNLLQIMKDPNYQWRY